ncbi:MAG: endonuclease V [Gemmataceae bacterium]|nr:endonuclease V [Gemmataceae bacterium]
MAPRIDVSRPVKSWATVAAADVSYNRFSNVICAAVVVWRPRDREVVEVKTSRVQTSFQYRTGLLSFREAPALLEAFRKLRNTPDVIMLDGQGLAHPRRFGLACHVGLWLGRPTFGIAKSRLVGTAGRLGERAGSRAILKYQGEEVGLVIRTKANCDPLFVSPGHRIDLGSAVAVTMGCLCGRRLPEPARLAHEAANDERRRIA